MDRQQVDPSRLISEQSELGMRYLKDTRDELGFIICGDGKNLSVALGPFQNRTGIIKPLQFVENLSRRSDLASGNQVFQTGPYRREPVRVVVTQNAKRTGIKDKTHAGVAP